MVVERLFAGTVQLIKALQPVVEAAETTLQLDKAKRTRTIIRVDEGRGTQEDLNWLLGRGYEIMAKEYSGRRIVRLAKTVTQWLQDPDWAERSCGLGERTAYRLYSPGEAVLLDAVVDKMVRWPLGG